MEKKSEIKEELSNGGKLKNWLQDNIRIILSILIVATIATGIYSYSKRTVMPTDEVDGGTEINLAKTNKEDVKNDENNAVVVVGEDNQDNKVEKNKNDSAKKLSVKQEESKKAAKNSEKTEKNSKIETKKVAKKSEEAVNTTEETEEAFIETANNGDSLTLLARQAVKHYLEKNPTEGLSAEHKIYMEDYLRKQIKHSTVVTTGEKISFSKDLISKAVDASKNLNEKQLKNLQKYSARVSGL